jgi:hypothetical protein
MKSGRILFLVERDAQQRLVNKLKSLKFTLKHGQKNLKENRKKSLFD